MQRIYLEAPCFGFGPISTSVSVANSLQKEYDIYFITYGEALQFLQKSTTYAYIEVDTRSEQEFNKISNVASKDDLFIVNTNIEFGTFLLQNDYKVLIIDTLYWMWNSAPLEYINHPYFIYQTYYGASVRDFPRHEECRPLINYDLWTESVRCKKSSALISFGGMSEPGDNTYIVNSAKAIIESIVDCLPEYITDIYVVGGLFDKKQFFDDSIKIHIVGCVDANEFHTVACECKYIFLSPGLTSVYEML